MKTNRKRSFGVRVLLTIGKIALFILAFPYQIVINRKEGRFSIRSLLCYLSLESGRKPAGDAAEPECEKKSPSGKTLTLSIPGFSIAELRKSHCKSCANHTAKE